MNTRQVGLALLGFQDKLGLAIQVGHGECDTRDLTGIFRRDIHGPGGLESTLGDGAEFCDMNIIAAGIKFFAVELAAIGSDSDSRRHILFYRVGTSQVEDNYSSRTSVGNIHLLDVDCRIGHA